MSPNTMAARLLGLSPSPEVTDALLATSDIKDVPVAVAATPTRTTGLRHARRNVSYALSVAKCADADADLLADLATMKQKTVRRAVARHPKTPLAALEDLAVWALDTDDVDTIHALLSTLPPPSWLPQVLDRFDTTDGRLLGTRHLGAAWLPTEKVAEQLHRRGDTDLVRETFALAIPSLCREIIKEAVYGRIVRPALTLEDLFDLAASIGGDVWDSTVDGAVTTKVELPDFVTDHIVNWAARSDLPRPGVEHLRSSAHLTAYAIDSYLATDALDLHLGVVNAMVFGTQVDDAQFATLVRTADPSVAFRLLDNRTTRMRLSVDQINHLVMSAHAPAKLVANLFTDRGADLTATARVELLRNGNTSITGEWLTGKLGVAPTLQEAASLSRNPGCALADNGLPVKDAEAPGVDDVASVITATHASIRVEHLGTPGLGDILNAAGGAVVAAALAPREDIDSHVIARPSGCAAYLAMRLNQAFGADPHAWVTATKVAEHLTNVATVDEFISVLAGMTHTV